MRSKARHMLVLKRSKLIEKAVNLAKYRLTLICLGSVAGKDPEDVRQTDEYRIAQAAHEQALQEIYEWQTLHASSR